MTSQDQNVQESIAKLVPKICFALGCSRTTLDSGCCILFER